MKFCLNPPAEWIGPVVKARFEILGGRKRSDGDTYHINEVWRPFAATVPKRDRKIALESLTDLPSNTYKMSQGSVAQVFAVCGSFFQHAIDEGFTEVNPFRAVKQKSIYKQRNTLDVASRSLTQLQWGFAIETAELMAAADPAHERTLFIVATLFWRTLTPSPSKFAGAPLRDSHTSPPGRFLSSTKKCIRWLGIYLGEVSCRISINPLETSELKSFDAGQRWDRISGGFK